MKMPCKEPRYHTGGICGPDGKGLAELRVMVIPDTYKRDAPRWVKAQARGISVTTRSEFAAKLRDMRASGYKANHRYSVLSNLIHFRVLQEIGEFRKSKRRRGRKAVAA
ncbi:hypothetical protein OJ996_20475 [Luteolibacter sp. GHJ8]|uniref:Uncharacterized protein n=1 Tax=Luteolibacter rhizosphaerae TaxID=2989719 RepID=A0ABT3G846_9BACT|nr:hypothetical protein [Luteolibacter rhizosphaerae]MCW1915975.1 hypothetical protein [Luteolibacter rhizosphaerae]